MICRVIWYYFGVFFFIFFKFFFCVCIGVLGFNCSVVCFVFWLGVRLGWVIWWNSGVGVNIWVLLVGLNVFGFGCLWYMD